MGDTVRVYTDLGARTFEVVPETGRAVEGEGMATGREHRRRCAGVAGEPPPADQDVAALAFAADWAAAWGELSFAIASGRTDGFARAGRGLVAVGRLIARLGEVQPHFTLVPAADHLAALAGDYRLGDAAQRAAHLLLAAAAGRPAGLLAGRLAEMDAMPALRLAFAWLPRFRERMIRLPHGVQLPPGVSPVPPPADAGHGLLARAEIRVVNHGFEGWRTPRCEATRVVADGEAVADPTAAVAEFGRFSSVVGEFSDRLLCDPRRGPCGVGALAEVVEGQWVEARLLADRLGVPPPLQVVVTSPSDFRAAMNALRQWGEKAVTAFAAPTPAIESPGVPSGDDGLQPRCRGRLRCSPDFGKVVAGGKVYHFTTRQKLLVEHMVKRTEAGHLTFSGEELFKKSESQATSRQVRDLFRSNGNIHQAWGRLIVEDDDAGRGWYRLALG
jgi:hypothetical protein